MKVYKAVFNSQHDLIIKTECSFNDVFGGENFDYEYYWRGDDLHILKDNINKDIYYVIEQEKE